MAFWKIIIIIHPIMDALRGFPLGYITTLKVSFPLIWASVIIPIVFLFFLMRKSTYISKDAVIISSVLIISILVSGLYSSLKENIDLVEFIKSSLHILFWLIFFVSLTVLPFTNDVLIKMGKIKIFVGCITALFGIYQYFAALYGWPLSRLEINSPALVGEYDRICSIYVEPIYLSMEMVFLIVIVLISYFTKLMGKRPAFILLMLYSFTLLLSASLSAIFVLLALFAILSLKFLGNRRSRRFVFKITTVIIILFLIVINIAPQIIEQSLTKRISGIIVGEHVTGESYSIRKYRLDLSLGYFLSNPIFGIGWGQGKVAFEGERVSSPYLTLLMELGIMALFFIFMVYICIKKYFSFNFVISDTASKIRFILSLLFLAYVISFWATGYLMDSALWLLLSMLINFKGSAVKSKNYYYPSKT